MTSDNRITSTENVILQKNSLKYSSSDEIKVLSIKGSDEDPEKLNDYSNQEFWQNFGNYNIVFDAESTRDSYITFELLLKSNADVLFLSNLFADNFVLDAQERQAIREYVKLGHGIIGTHGSLEPIGHSDLAPLFGINPTMIESTQGFMPIIDSQNPFDLTGINDPIFDGMSKIYSTGHSPTMSAYVDGENHPWTNDNRIMLENGSLLATSSDGNAAIIKAEGLFNSVYLTHFHIRNSLNQDDDQLLFNSIIWVASKSRGNQIFSFRALIDGEDDLLLRGNELWYNHKEFCLPGLHESNNFSTQINNYHWFPKFPFIMEEQLYLAQESEPLTSYSYIPKYEIDYSIELIEISEGGNVEITQQPSIENDYTLVISIHDGHVGGSWWYEFNVLYKTDTEYPIVEIQDTNSDVSEEPSTITPTPEDPELGIETYLFFYSIITTFALVITVIKKKNNNPQINNENTILQTHQVRIDPQIQYCFNCGNRMRVSTKFCENCGLLQEE